MSELPLKERFKDWFMDSPAVGITVAAGMMGYGLIRSLAVGVKSEFDFAVRPISYFEPEPPKDGPDLNDQIRLQQYQGMLEWTTTVMGEGRAEGLLNRLRAENLPEISRKGQGWALAQSYAGIKNLPQHEHLVKYGLNDRYLAEVTGSIRCAINRDLREFGTEIPRSEWMDKPKTFIEGEFSTEGLKRVSTGELVRDREFFIQCCIKPELSSDAFYHKADPGIPDKIAGIVLDWLVEDVKPAVPDIFGDMKVSEFTPEYKPQGFHQQTPSGSSPS